MSTYDSSVRFWDSVEISPLNYDLPALSLYCRELGEAYSNGTVLLRTYQLGTIPVDSPDELLAVTCLLKSRLPAHPRIMQDFGSYRLNEGANREREFQEIHPFELPGLLATRLQAGGAYSSIRKDMECFRRSLAAALDFCGGDLNTINVWECRSAWSSFFKDVAWDLTLILLRPSDRLLGVVMATDED